MDPLCFIFPHPKVTLGGPPTKSVIGYFRPPHSWVTSPCHCPMFFWWQKKKKKKCCYRFRVKFFFFKFQIFKKKLGENVVRFMATSYCFDNPFLYKHVTNECKIYFEMLTILATSQNPFKRTLPLGCAFFSLFLNL